MTEKVRLTVEQKEKNNQTIEKIKVFTQNIKDLLPDLSGNACIDAYTNSVSNLETKNQKYYTDTFLVSDEEKELLRKIREGKISITEKESGEVSPDNETGKDEPIHKISKKGMGKKE